MIIDVHCHATRPPPQLPTYRKRLLTEGAAQPVPILSDEEVRLSVQEVRRLADERGIDHVVLSPRASAMGHESGSSAISIAWTRACNDFIGRVRDMFPAEFSASCQLPQSVTSSPSSWVPELRRCVHDRGFVGCNVNPDISGGIDPRTPPLGDRWWYPLWEALVSLDVPVMLHASQTRVPGLHMNGAHYINVDYTAVIDMCRSQVLDDFPHLKVVIPHGGGAAPFQYSRLRALAVKEGWHKFEEHFLKLYFDTTLYGEEELELLCRKVRSRRLLFGSEMLGTGAATNPDTGMFFDDNLPLVRRTLTNDAACDAVLGANARILYKLEPNRISRFQRHAAQSKESHNESSRGER